MDTTKVRRINFFAGAGSGKSTTSAWLFARMKQDKYSVELVQEYVKTWAYEKKVPTSFDQIYLFAKQMRKEDLVLRNDVSYLISDSPLFLSICYAKKHNPAFADNLFGISQEFERKYPSINIFINRDDKQYINQGRYETYEQAKEMDQFILSELLNNNIMFYTFNYSNLENMYNFIIELLGENK